MRLSFRLSFPLSFPLSVSFIKLITPLALYLSVLSTLSACGSAAMRSEEAPYPSRHQRAVDDPIVPVAQDSSQWIIEGKIRVSVLSMDTTLNELRAQLKDKGDVTRQDVRGQRSFPLANLTLRVKPKELPGLLAWLRKTGQVEYEEVSREEVSRRLLAQDVTIKNAQTTLERLKIFIGKDSLKVDEVLRVEGELARLRKVIESTERERELLKGRISFATLHVTLSERPKRLPRAPKAKFYVAGRPTFILSGDKAPEGGWGVSLFNPRNPAAFHVDFDYFAPSQRTFLTIGSATYSEFFGDGQNHFLNPHVGFKVGYAQADGHNLVFGASVGLELARFKYAFINLRGEGLGLMGAGGLEWLTVGGLDLAVVY